MNVIINTTLSTIVGMLIGYIIKLVNERKTEKEALKCLLRSEITQLYYTIIERGFIHSHEKENINYLYSAYEGLKGNSYVSSLVRELNDLPVQN